MTAGGARVVIAAGGTGGHIFPGLALARALRRADPGTEVLFIGSADRLESRLVPGAGWPFRAVAARGLKGMGPGRRAANALVLPLSVLQAGWHLVRFWPRLVVGMGGYVAGPVLAAAWLLGRKVAIHEQNVSPGWTNRLLARLADLAMVSFPETAAAFRRRRVVVTGNPVREEAVGAAEGPGEGRRDASPAGGGGFRLLVVGGSQGSSSLNRMTAAALEMLGGEVSVVHGSGDADEAWVRERYAKMGVRAEVLPFIRDMGRRYRWADVVVCRAGATTLAELAVNGCAAVFVPFPGAAEGHQEENARWLAGRGAARVVADRGVAAAGDLARELRELRDNPERRAAMARAAAALAVPDADRRMAEACAELMHTGRR